MEPVQFIKEVPNKFFTSLLVDDFAELASVVMEGGLHQELEENFWRATFTGTNENIWLAGLLNESPKMARHLWKASYTNELYSPTATGQSILGSCSHFLGHQQ